MTSLTLLRRYELDVALAVPLGVPVDELVDPLTGLLFVTKWPAGNQADSSPSLTTILSTGCHRRRAAWRTT